MVNALISDAAGRKLTVQDGWIICPDCCRGRLIPVLPETEGRSIPVYCKRCRRQHVLNIERARA